MPLLDYGLSLQQAIARSHDIYNVFYTSWGSSALDRYPLRTLPGLSDSFAGIAIGSQSDINRVWVSWNPGAKLIGAGGETQLMLACHEISVDRPALFSIQGSKGPPLSTISTIDPNQDPYLAMREGLLYVFPFEPMGGAFDHTSRRSTLTPSPYSYRKADGTAATMDLANQVRWQQPKLHLQLLLKADAQVTTRRTPRHWSSGQANTANWGIGNGAEFMFILLPIYGRRNVTIMCASNQANTTFRIAVLRNTGVPIIVADVPQEVTVGEKTPAAANESVGFQLCDPNADYVLLYGNAPAGPDATVKWSVEAYD